MRAGHRIAGLAGAMALACTLSAAVAPAANAAAPCSGATVERLLAARTPVLDWSENVTFDADGNLWVARGLRGVVERYSPGRRLTATVRVAEPGSIRLGPDGLLYVASGDAPQNMVPTAPRTGSVVRIDPRAPRPTPRLFAAGLGMPNGLAFGPDRHLYVADSRLGLLRITPAGRLDSRWSARAPKSQSPTSTVNGFGLNGIAASGDALYVTLTSSLTSRVLRVPIADPARATVAADLTTIPGPLDDLAVPHPGLLVVTSTTGQIITTDVRTHAKCSVDVGQPVTSVAADPAHPGRLVAGTESGDVLVVKWRPAG